MPKILIVDDNKDATDLIEIIVRSKGYEAVSLNESYKVMDVATALRPDIFILDLMMPKPDGFQLCRMLRANPTFSLTPIIIVTALNDLDSRVVAFGAGASDYLTKPYDARELLSKIKDHLDAGK